MKVSEEATSVKGSNTLAFMGFGFRTSGLGLQGLGLV